MVNPVLGRSGTHTVSLSLSVVQLKMFGCNITGMNNARIDLNFYNFPLVTIERSVTRAAQRLGMTQPAVRNALSRLRHLFRDELFTKVRGRMEPTERAIAIRPEVHDAIEKLSAV